MRTQQPRQLSLDFGPSERFREALLTRPIPMKDGQFLRTLAQARALTEKHKTGRFRDPWSRAEPLIAKAEASGSPESLDRVTGQLEIVLFGRMELKL